MTVTLLLRLVHIVLGVFWAGTIFFLVSFLAPALGKVGPDGGKVVRELDQARFFEIMPAVALVTILSGAWLMGILSGGFDAAFLRSPWGLSLLTGAAAALAALAIGVLVMRPATKRILTLAPGLAAAGSDEERGRIGAEVQALRARSRVSSLWVAALLLVAVASMAAARYL